MRTYPIVTVTEKGEKFLRGGHVWVYADEVTATLGDLCDGELCDVYYELEFYDEAIEVGEEHYAYLLKKHGADDEYVLMACESLAKVYFFNSDYSEAHRYLDTYVTAYEKRDGSEEKLIVAYYNISLCAYLNEDTDGAKRYAQKMHKLLNASIGEKKALHNEAMSLCQRIQNDEKCTLIFIRWNDLWGRFL